MLVVGNMVAGNAYKLFLLFISITIVINTFYLPANEGVKTSDDYVDCSTCHLVEAEEFHSNTGPHRTLECTSCHNISDFAPDLYSHNATTFECSYCHPEQNASRFYDEAHNNFSNALCIGCHTNIEFITDWQPYRSTSLNASNHGGLWEINFTSIDR
jgi:hypothetical protein